VYYYCCDGERQMQRFNLTRMRNALRRLQPTQGARQPLDDLQHDRTASVSD